MTALAGLLPRLRRTERMRHAYFRPMETSTEFIWIDLQGDIVGCDRICVRGEGCESPRRGGRTGARAAGWGLPAQGRCGGLPPDRGWAGVGRSGVGLGGAEGGLAEVLEGDVEGFAEGFVGGGFGEGLVFYCVEEGVDEVELFFGGECFEGVGEGVGLEVGFGGVFGLDAEGGFAGFGDLGVLADGLCAAV